MTELSAEYAAEIIVSQGFSHLDAMILPENLSKEEIRVRNAQLQHLFDRGSLLLADQGHTEIMGEMIDAIDGYYKNLFYRTTTTRFLDSRGGKQTDPELLAFMSEAHKKITEIPIYPPDIDSMAERLREPYSSLLKFTGLMYNISWQPRYAKMRDAVNILMGFNSIESSE